MLCQPHLMGYKSDDDDESDHKKMIIKIIIAIQIFRKDGVLRMFSFAVLERSHLGTSQESAYNILHLWGHL
jgi:hypothetical protein